MAKVTGIGGVFFKAKNDNKVLAQWYRQNLGIELSEFGGSILSWQLDEAEDQGMTVWHIAEQDSEWFSPSTSEFMINYRIDNMDEMVDQLLGNGVKIHQGPEKHENGKFLWIMDPEGNKVELWEPMIWNEANRD